MNMIEERINELKHKSIEINTSWKTEIKDWKILTASKVWGTISKGLTSYNLNSQKEIIQMTIDSPSVMRLENRETLSLKC